MPFRNAVSQIIEQGNESGYYLQAQNIKRNLATLCYDYVIKIASAACYVGMSFFLEDVFLMREDENAMELVRIVELLFNPSTLSPITVGAPALNISTSNIQNVALGYPALSKGTNEIPKLQIHYDRLDGALIIHRNADGIVFRHCAMHPIQTERYPARRNAIMRIDTSVNEIPEIEFLFDTLRVCEEQDLLEYFL